MRWHLYAHAHDRIGQGCETSWNEFCDAVLTGLTETADVKENLPAFGPYELRGTRNGANVTGVTALVFDLDNGAPDWDAVQALEVNALAYETPSSTEAAERWRLVFELDGPLSPEQLPTARQTIVEMLGLDPDPVTGDPSRLYFVGALEGTAERHAKRWAGEPIPIGSFPPVSPRPTNEMPRTVTQMAPSGINAPPALVEHLADLMRPAWDAGERQSWFLQALGWLAGKSWTQADLTNLVEALGEIVGGDHPIETYAAMVPRATPLSGPSDAVKAALGESFDEADAAVKAHPGSAANQIRAAMPDEPEALPYIVQSSRQFWLRKIGANDYEGPYDYPDLCVRIDRSYGPAFPHRCEMGEIRAARVLSKDGAIDLALEVRRDFKVGSTTFAPSSKALTEGYTPPHTPPKYDADVEAWLNALVGSDALPDLYDWIASCRQDLLHQPAAALVLVGGPDLGKTLLFTSVAKLWGRDWVPLHEAIAQFNVNKTRCPIWLDDECAAMRTEKIESWKFRAMVQDVGHSYEKKGQDMRFIHGCARLGITANEIDDIRFRGCNGADALHAVADRLALHRCRAAARGKLDALRLGHYQVDVGRIAGHAAWIQSVVTPRSQRFLGARADNTDPIRAVLSQVVQANPELFDMLTDYLESKGAVDLTYRESSGMLMPGQAKNNFPIIVWHGILCMQMGTLAQALEHQKYTLQRVSSALQPFREGHTIRPQLWGHRRYVPLNVVTLVKALPELDEDAAIETMATDTATRRGESEA